MKNIKAIFPAGVTAITVNGLHQWDYGRTLEITADDLPALVEVHFACPGMKEAEVRVCSAASGTASAVIPDRCLEQTAPITAWVFIIDDTAGYTVKTITLPVIARVKPQPGESVPEEHYDKYTELITAVNAAVASLAEGNVKVQAAYEADHATEADSATEAGSAATATNATLLKPQLLDLAYPLTYASLTKPGLYMVELEPYSDDTAVPRFTSIISVTDLSPDRAIRSISQIDTYQGGVNNQVYVQYTAATGLSVYNVMSSASLPDAILAVYCLAEY